MPGIDSAMRRPIIVAVRASEDLPCGCPRAAKPDLRPKPSDALVMRPPDSAPPGRAWPKGSCPVWIPIAGPFS
jgi:hypothetical protein